MIARRQLLSLGVNSDAIDHRLKTGRLHRAHQGVYAVGRPELTRYGRWIAAVLACGDGAVLSHLDAAALWEIRPPRSDPIHVSVVASSFPRCPGIVVHRRKHFTTSDVTRHCDIPVTTPVCTLIDVSTCFDRDALEAAINEADKRDLVDPERLRLELDTIPRRPGIGVLREVLDRRTFTLTDSELERLFLPIAREAGLSKPVTGAYVNGFKVDFYWSELGSSLKRTAFATTARRRSRLAIESAIKRILPRD